MKTWPIASISVPRSATREAWELFCPEVCEVGAIGFEEQGEWEDGVPREAIFYFPQQALGEDGLAEALEVRIRELAAEFLPADGLLIKTSLMPDRDWTAGWREHYRLARASVRVYVGPPEEPDLPATAPDDAVHVVLDDVRPFGGGTHPTTRGCLALIERLEGECRSLLDLGTGTGILCFAAVLLGYEYALGMDSVAEWAESFTRNARLNECEEHTAFLLGSTVEEAVAGTLLAGWPLPDLLVCNMLSVEFDAFLVPMRRLRRPLVLSGFLLSESEVIRARLEECGWVVEEETSLNEWGTWLCRPSPAGARNPA